MDAAGELAQWAWARHHNTWSWYVRPLFLLPLCWFAWRRSLAGIALTLLALISSMAWFPAPSEPDPAVTAMLAAERAYLTGPWTWWKLALAALVPLSLGLLVAAVWCRSLTLGLWIITAIMAVKVTWTFVFAPLDGAMAHLAPALGGFAVCLVAILWARRRVVQK
ncbi:MAG: hypothetical protein ACRCUE_11745 [Bosea sp. (in: a-proteobacteria)]